MCKVSLCSAHQEPSNDIDVDLEVTLRSRDLIQLLTLKLCGYHILISMCINEGISRVLLCLL